MDSNKILNMSIGKLILVLILVGLMVTGGSYAYWMWTSNVNKNVVFNTISGLEDYIVYDEGESYFVGNFQPTDTFCQNVSNTISFKKTSEVSELIFLATIYMDINSIGDNISQSNDVYWVVTEGDNTISCEAGLNSELVLASGTFKNKKSGDTIKLLDRIEVLETEKQYTVWIWIDSMGTDLSNLSGETIDANVWTEFKMTDTLEEEIIEINPVESYSCANGSAGSEPYDITYTGDCEVIDDEDGNWRIKFLTSGIFKTDTDIEIDAFLVGGGGGGGISGATTAGGEGGGGGGVGSSRYGGSGGSGGGAGGNGSESGSAGGTNGSNALDSSGKGGSGQGTSTYEFGDSSLTLYSGGGGGGAGYNSSTYVYQSAGKGGAGGGGNGGKRGIGNSAAANTGGGGGGGSSENVSGGSGGSGIAVIRNKR